MNPSYLQIGDELLSDALLDTVTVTQELNRHWWLDVRFRQTTSEVFAALKTAGSSMDERPPYESYLGRPCQLFTYDENGARIVTFEGFVFRSQLQYELYGSSRGHLVAVSQSHKMDLTPRHACYTSSSLRAIASQIAGLTGLSASVQASAQTAPKQYVQWAKTDFRFLHRLADDHRAWLRPTANGIEVFDMFQGGVPLTFREEYGLLSFDVEGGIGPAAMDGCHYDPQPMASRTYSQVTAPPAFTGASGTLTDAILQGSQQMPPGYLYDRSRTPALADYEARLKLESERALGSQIVAHGISRELRVKAGDKIEIGGVIRAQGTYGVTKVVHRWTLKGYENEFWATSWEKWLEAEAPARPIVDGVFPARVIQHSDPEKMGRHRIRFWWQEEGEPMLWARMMTPHAGQNRGLFFQPEVGDEVVVMFEDGDPERPVILGCVWNGVDTAPTADFWGGEYADNDVKRIVTKSGNRIQMVDKPGQEAISLSTPDNLKISMYEQANETGRPMIEILNRNGDISFLAPDGRIHFHSQLFSREVGSEGIVTPPAAPPSKSDAPATPSLMQAAAVAPVEAAGFTGGGEGGMTPGERAVICGCVCECNASAPVSATGAELKQICVSSRLVAYDAAQQHKSTIKAEVSYDMTSDPPRPIMVNDNALRPHPPNTYPWQKIPNFQPGQGMLRRPDVVIVSNPNLPPTQDNIRSIVEIKFPPDAPNPFQRQSYGQILGGNRQIEELSPEACGCPSEKEQRQRVPVIEPVPAKKPESHALRDGLLIVGGAAVVAAAIVLLPEEALVAAGYGLVRLGAYLLP